MSTKVGYKNFKHDWDYEGVPCAFNCPKCDKYHVEIHDAYCRHCGENLDWSDINKSALGLLDAVKCEYCYRYEEIEFTHDVIEFLNNIVDTDYDRIDDNLGIDRLRDKLSNITGLELREYEY